MAARRRCTRSLAIGNRCLTRHPPDHRPVDSDSAIGLWLFQAPARARRTSRLWLFAGRPPRLAAMEWTEEGIVLTARRHGESSAIVTLLTREQGRHAGLVRGGFGRAQRGLLEPGNRVRARWRARLAEHLGTLTCEPVDSTAAALLDDPLRLAALSAATGVAEAALPEREPHARVHDGLQALLDLLRGPATIAVWGQAHAGWERDLLADLGFGLDLTRCAVSGTAEGLAFVSPEAGRAVSRAAGGGWGVRAVRP